MIDEDYVSYSGKPTALGRMGLENLRDDITRVLSKHLDNTGMVCRVDISNALDTIEGHDCCYICNRVGAALGAALGDVCQDAAARMETS